MEGTEYQVHLADAVKAAGFKSFGQMMDALIQGQVSHEKIQEEVELAIELGDVRTEPLDYAPPRVLLNENPVQTALVHDFEEREARKIDIEEEGEVIYTEGGKKKRGKEKLHTAEAKFKALFGVRLRGWLGIGEPHHLAKWRAINDLCGDTTLVGKIAFAVRRGWISSLRQSWHANDTAPEWYESWKHRNEPASPW